MAVFSRFAELPKELQLMIWEAAIPQSPSVHFLSYPPKKRHATRTYQWQSELADTNRTINVDKDTGTGEPSTRARTWGRYSSYFTSLALLHACRDSRRVCVAHTASIKGHHSDADRDNSSNIVSTDYYTLNLATDIICIQDPDPRFPWNQPRRISLSPRLDPLRIALERRPSFYCDDIALMGNWLVELSGGLDGDSWFGTSLCHREFEGPLSLKMIYLLDYDIKPKYPTIAETSQADHDAMKPPSESEIKSDDGSAVKLPGHTSAHNGKFHGHGVTFYALSANIQETSVGWVIPQESLTFYSDVCEDIQHFYQGHGYKIVDSVEDWEEWTDELQICIEFLACVKA